MQDVILARKWPTIISTASSAISIHSSVCVWTFVCTAVQYHAECMKTALLHVAAYRFVRIFIIAIRSFVSMILLEMPNESLAQASLYVNIPQNQWLMPCPCRKGYHRPNWNENTEKCLIASEKLSIFAIEWIGTTSFCQNSAIRIAAATSNKYHLSPVYDNRSPYGRPFRIIIAVHARRHSANGLEEPEVSELY